FCKIIRKEIEAKFEYEDDDVIVVRDINPQAPAHLLIIPKKHIDRISSVEQTDLDTIGKVIYQAKQIAARNGWEHYRLVFNNGEQAGQSVFHIHLHLLSGRPMRWPPG
ncbi:MAG: HIT domain-containing protein, partial [Candidatus Omnitrophica bacterium]|nr:HIT domain-containing protein [Candidatus Omnitrophota bacterium]